MAKRQKRHPHIMTILPWSTPFFSPEKRHIASFLQAVNVGTSTTPQPSLSSDGTPPLSPHPLACLPTTISTHGPAPLTARTMQVSSVRSFYWCKNDTPKAIGTPENNDFLTTTLQTRFRIQPSTIATPSITTQSVLTPTTTPYLLHTTKPQTTT